MADLLSLILIFLPALVTLIDSELSLPPNVFIGRMVEGTGLCLVDDNLTCVNVGQHRLCGDRDHKLVSGW